MQANSQFLQIVFDIARKIVQGEIELTAKFPLQY